MVSELSPLNIFPANTLSVDPPYNEIYPITKSRSTLTRALCLPYKERNIIKAIQGGPEQSRQSNLALFTIESGLVAKVPHVK